MSSKRDSKYSWFQRLCMNVITSGEIPKHIAFIMDGNRRFAQNNQIKKIEGHSKGIDTIVDILQLCFDLGIPEVTVYAFSIENFKRSQEEVEAFMNLAKDKVRCLLPEKRDELIQSGICTRVIGDLSLLDDEFKKYIAKVMLLTKDYTKGYLNIAFAYTSREEITTAIKALVEGVENKTIEISDISENLLSSCLYTNKSSNPDLLIRTSGEVRFSDFLLWQTSATPFYFTDILWPEFNFWKLLGAIFFYQRQLPKINDMKSYQNVLHNNDPSTTNNEQINRFLNELEQKRWATLEAYAKL